MAETLEVVAHLLLLGGKLVGIVEGLPTASATGAEMGATRGDTLIGVVVDGHGAALGITLFLLEDFDVGYVAGDDKGDEDDHAVNTGNGLAFSSDVGDGDVFENGLLFFLLHGCGVWDWALGKRGGEGRGAISRRKMGRGGRMQKKKYCNVTILLFLFAKSRMPGFGSIRSYRSSETVSFFLPFLRRAAKTLRPLAVDILWRNPCLLALFLRDGWNVLFIFLQFFELQKYELFFNWQEKSDMEFNVVSVSY